MDLRSPMRLGQEVAETWYADLWTATQTVGWWRHRLVQG